MTRIDCRTAAEYGLNPTEYVGQFIHQDGDCILLVMDEEENGFIRLDADSAEFLARKLLTMVEAIRKDRQPGRTSTASSHG
jgi:hypothetical protein